MNPEERKRILLEVIQYSKEFTSIDNELSDIEAEVVEQERAIQDKSICTEEIIKRLQLSARDLVVSQDIDNNQKQINGQLNNDMGRIMAVIKHLTELKLQFKHQFKYRLKYEHFCSRINALGCRAVRCYELLMSFYLDAGDAMVSSEFKIKNQSHQQETRNLHAKAVSVWMDLFIDRL